MPERHLYRLKAFVGEARCARVGCPEHAVYEGLYQFQHDDEVDATLRRWPFCLRHAQGWAHAHGVVCPEIDSHAKSLEQAPAAVERLDEGEASMPLSSERRPLGSRRLWGERARRRLRRGT